MNNPWRTRIVLAVIVASVLLYGVLFVPSVLGYGYASPGARPSFWAFETIDFYRDVSVRAGSRSGPGVSGGGK